jgi:hypothetical protein
MKPSIQLVKTTFSSLILAVAAATAHADSYEDGLMAYANGNYEESAVHLKMAATQGSVGAEQLLMQLYTEEKLKSGDADKEALKWTRKAAENGIKQAQFALAENFAKKEGNVKEALQWYLLAANQNHPDAFYALGEIYNKGGEGVDTDSQKSVRMYQIALSEFDVFAQKGHPGYQFALAGMYQHAKGVSKNMKLAVKWMGKSAQQGHAQAQFALGHLYASGRDVERDIPQAKYWLDLAAAQGLGSAVALLEKLKHHQDDILAYSL